ncbi:MAG TPA: hypothetical protein VGZ91_13005 [Candidatus Sulfotelmatobacter sp.]|jgi:hypothetical protein|nr:hypothetical protein [Candidatus Sulfotelmatobacter sp.]
MSRTRNSGPECPISLRPKTTITTKVLIVSALAVIACCLFSISASAQTPLSLGTLTTLGNPSSCNSGSGFYYYIYPNTGLALDMNCQAAKVSGCNNLGVTTSTLNVTIGYLSPVGVVPGVTVANGLVVLHGGGNGTAPESFALTDNYFRAGYEVVQVVWADDWEMISDPITGYGNIQAAACRPATVFNWVNTNLFLTNVLNNNSRAGMCALGDSAGSAAVAYSMAYYNAGSYLDNVELLSGPVLSDIEQGCQWKPQAASVTVCSSTSNNGGYGCQLGGGSTWTLSPTYLSGANSSVGGWTNDMSCANANGLNQSTTQQSETQWLLQSLVDQSNITGLGATPTFNYPSTAMSAWLCRSVQANPNFACAANNNNNYNSCPNNSSPQGQLFYQNILSTSPPPHFAVYAVDNCSNAEGVGGGTVPGFYPQYFGGTQSGGGNAGGMTAITDDMVGSTPAQIPAQCVRRSH